MTSASALANTVALLLFQDFREGMETGRIADMETARTEVESAITQLNRGRPLDEPSHINDLVAKLLLEIGSLHEKVAKCESQLADFQSRAEVLKEETTRITSRADACNEQQQKENDRILAAIESVKASISTAPTPYLAPVSSPTDLIVRPAPSRMAIVSFPGGPRTITIHPPGSPNYQPIIRDENGDVIITLKATKPLVREGAFIGPLEDIDWVEIHRVCGRGPEIGGSRAVPPVPRWPDHSQTSYCPPPRSPGDIIARQRQLSFSMQTDAFGRVLAPDYLIRAKSPSLPTGMSSSSLRDLQSFSSVAPEITIIPSSTPPSPPSPSVRRSRKRVRYDDEDERVPSITEGAPPPSNSQIVKEPTTPTSAKRPPEGRPLRKKFRSSRSVEASRAGSLSRVHSLLDVTRTV